MNQQRIFFGNAGFLVETVDKETGEELLTYLGREGFGGTKWINLPKSGMIHVNIESMRYGLTIIGIRIASNNYDEIPDHPFTVNEFKNIWEVIKKHHHKERVASCERKYLDVGFPCFIVRQDDLKDKENNFWTYLEDEGFKALTYNDTPPGWVLVNVANSTYINYTDNEEIISYVRDNCENALTCEEFKTIWNEIRKHR